MQYGKSDAKDYARSNMKGIWAAALTPFAPDGAIDEAGFRGNLRHWVDDLGIDGVFVCGKQGEFFSMSVPERKRTFEIAVEELRGRAGTIMSCSDQNMDVVIDLARHAEAIGADYIVVHAPVLHFFHAQDETLYEYYRAISSAVNIGIALWSHPDSGYLMSPELCARIAHLPNVVAIKYSVPREMYARLTRLAGGRILVSTASEEEWFDNIVELGWQLYLCSSPPYIFQTKVDRRMREYTDLAMRGEIGRAKVVRDSLNPVRQAFRHTRPPEKFHSHSKYWQELLGQVGGAVRRPMLELTQTEKEAIRGAFEASGLKLERAQPKSSAA
jgi:4-hydroxy-tetrahydrodipicolinate synthase